MVTTFYPPFHFGGDAIHVHRLSESLARRGHEVTVYYSPMAYHLLTKSAPPDWPADHPNVRRRPLRSRFPALAMLASQQLGRPVYTELLDLDARGYDAIHFHNISLMGGPGILRRGRTPRLYTAHEYWLICPTHVLMRNGREACNARTCLSCTLTQRRPPQPWRLGHLVQAGMDEVDVAIAPSEFARRRHESEGVRAPWRVLPYFVPEAHKVPSLKEARERPYFLLVGRLEYLKAIDEAIEWFRDFREADLVIVGKGAAEAALRAQASSLAHVRFLPHKLPQELLPLYQHALATLVPSRCYETFGLTVAESLIAGTPVLARRIGALTEGVEASGGGLLFDDRAGAIEALRRLAGEPRLRALLSESGQRYAQQHWTEASHMNRYFGLVDEAIANRRRRA